jgi:transmembrane sensor
MQADRANEIDPTAPVTEQASAWWILLNEGHATEADQRAFSGWVTRSPERISAYLQAAQVAGVFRSPHTQWPDTPIDELIRTAAESHVTPLPVAVADVEPSARSIRRAGRASHSGQSSRVIPGETASSRPFARRAALAVLFSMALVAISLYFFYPRPEHFETALGEQHSAVLSDGSLVTLNTTSAIEVHFGKEQRRVTLHEGGEALFQVAHDAVRPFEVTAGDVTVRAVGTKFNVDRHLHALKVTVIDGRVQVSTATERVPLSAGEQLAVTREGAQKVSLPNISAATAWTRRQLIFESRPLGEVAAEINRYNRKIIVIQSTQLRGEQVTGVFQSDDPASFLAFLDRIPGVSVEASADRYIVRRSAGQP